MTNKKAKGKGAASSPPVDHSIIAREFARATARDQQVAEQFAYHIASLASEIPAPIYSTKERRASLRRAASAFLKAGEELGALDGVSVLEMLTQVSALRAPPGQAKPLMPDEVWARRENGSLAFVSRSASLGEGLFEFGRHGLPIAPSVFRNHEYSATLVDLIHDLELLHAGAARAAKGNLGPTVDSRGLLAKNLVDTFAVFNVEATGTPEGLAALCMRAILAARGDAGSGWDPLESTCRHASLSIL